MGDGGGGGGAGAGAGAGPGAGGGDSAAAAAAASAELAIEERKAALHERDKVDKKRVGSKAKCVSNAPPQLAILPSLSRALPLP